jgi:phosphoribosylformylglycinamidine synthase
VRWVADVHVRLHPGIADPEGQTIAGGLRALGFESVAGVRSGKLLRIAFEADDREAADDAVRTMCRRLLANPVMETADWELREAGTDGAANGAAAEAAADGAAR